MAIADILNALRARGVRLCLDFTPAGVEPSIRGKVSADDAALIREHRDAIIALLLREAQEAAEATDDPAAEGRDVRWFVFPDCREMGGLRREVHSDNDEGAAGE